MSKSYDEFRGKYGVWVVYYYGDSGLAATSLHEKAEYAILAHTTGDHIAFWPVGMNLAEGVNWFDGYKPTEPKPEFQSNVTFEDHNAKIGNIVPQKINEGVVYGIYADDGYIFACDGRVLSIKDFPRLFEILGHRFTPPGWSEEEFGIPVIKA